MSILPGTPVLIDNDGVRLTGHARAYDPHHEGPRGHTFPAYLVRTVTGELWFRADSVHPDPVRTTPRRPTTSPGTN